NDGMHFLRFFVNPATIDVNNIGMSGAAGSMTPFSSKGFNSFSAIIRNGTFSSDGNTGQAIVVIKNTAVADNLADYLFKARGNNLYNKWEFNNFDVGSAINGTTEKNAGVADATSDIQIKLIKEDYTGIEGAIGFMTLAGGTTVMDPSVENYATAYRDYTADQEFVMVTDVNGESSVEKVLLGVLHASDNANGQEMALETFTSLPLDFEE
ncbi:MAG: hypothetical protein GY829_10485, partial [Gammaproteobacteria bacterium]|nr:hypothetical protein [Gammaproteobacteria bacterium]